MKNYIDLGRSPTGAWENYVYLDTEDFLAKSLLVRQMIRAKVEHVMGRDNEKYKLVALKVLKKDEPLFRRAMEELKGKMLLFDHKDYESRGGQLMELTRAMIRNEAAETGRVELPKGRTIPARLLPPEEAELAG